MIVPRDSYEPITAEAWTKLAAAYPNCARIEVAMRLALDWHTFQALHAGEPVDPDRLDADELRQACERHLVRLDLREIDLLVGGRS